MWPASHLRMSFNKSFPFTRNTSVPTRSGRPTARHWYSRVSMRVGEMPSIPLGRMAAIFKKLRMDTWLFGRGNRSFAKPSRLIGPEDYANQALFQGLGVFQELRGLRLKCAIIQACPAPSAPCRISTCPLPTKCSGWPSGDPPAGWRICACTAASSRRVGSRLSSRNAWWAWSGRLATGLLPTWA